MNDREIVEDIMENIDYLKSQNNIKEIAENASVSVKSRDLRLRLYKQLDNLLDTDYAPKSLTALVFGNKIFFLLQLLIFGTSD
jgi:hypothetical protein